MSKDLAPRDPSSPARRRGGEVAVPQGGGGEISTRSSGQLRYISAALVGFANVPGEVVRQLRGQGIIAESEIAAWAEPPVARRRPDGSAYQVVSAWWADTARLVVFDAVRDLAETGKGRFQPAGGWVPRGTVYRFPPGVSPVTYSSTPEEGGAGKGGTTGADPVMDDPLDVLPEYLQSPLRGGAAGACLQTARKWACETIMAQSVQAGRIHVLRAERNASSKRSLSQATWTITSLDAPVHAAHQLGAPQRRSQSLDVSRPQTTLDVSRPQAPSIEPPRTYW